MQPQYSVLMNSIDSSPTGVEENVAEALVNSIGPQLADIDEATGGDAGSKTLFSCRP